MTIRTSTKALAAITLFSAAAAGAEEQTFELRPVALIQQHLYEGALRGPEGVYVDHKHNELWVCDTQNNLVGIFTLDGMPLLTFASAKYLREPKSLVVAPDGRTLILERDRSSIRTFNYRGEYQGDLVPPSLPEKPVIASIAADGEFLYVAESTEGEVFVYDYPSMKLRRRFGSRGDEEGQFQSIAAIAVDAAHIYVLDYTGLAVQIFDKRGNFIRGWGRHAMGAMNFSLPAAIAVDAKGRIAVTDALRQDIKYFDPEGRLLGHFGGAGRSLGNVSAPSGIAVAPDGRVYVAERGNGRVQVFAEEQLTRPVPVR